ncbi:MAG: DUF4352 domain-containing protein [Dehalococcoidia bacterium]|nr:DUF4352 domain-containing protein [Dehalococcoidia bacterium]
MRANQGKMPNSVTIAILLTVVASLVGSAIACSGGKPPPVTAYYQVGQYAETSDVILIIGSAERTDKYNRAGFQAITALYEHAPSGTEFVIIEATVTNVGRSQISIGPEDFLLTDSQGREYKPVGYKGLYPYPHKRLPAGQTASGVIAFVVPEIAAGLEATSILSGSAPIHSVWVLAF